MDEELSRCKYLAARARQMAKLALRQADKVTLLSITKDHERLCAEIEARIVVDDNQAG